MNKKKKKRYFFISYNFSVKNNLGWGWGQIWKTSYDFPNYNELLKEVIKHEPNIDGKIIVTNIIEFRTKQDYNDFIRDINE